MDAAEYDERVLEAGDESSSATLVAAGLIGAAIGAGLGLLASRALAEDASYADAMRRKARRARRDAAHGLDRAERRIRRRGAAVADEAGEAWSAAVRSIGRSREDFGDRVERELRALRKLVQRGRRRGWLR